MVLWLKERRLAPMAGKFACPLIPIVPAFGLAINVLMMTGLSYRAWIRLFGWLAIGVVIYFGWSIRHSNLRNPTKPVAAPTVAYEKI